LKKERTFLLIGVILLSIFGLIMIYSASNIWSEYKYNDPYKYIKSQGLFLIVGYITLFIISKISYLEYKKKSNIIFIICTVLLSLVLIPGIGTVRNGSRSWFGIGSLGIQPSEFTKLGLIIFTSKYLSNNQKEIKRSITHIRSTLISIWSNNVRTRLWYRSSYSYDYNSIIIYKWSKNEFLY